MKKGVTPREVPVREVQRALLARKAYIAPLYDVRPDDPDFELLQRIAATGILRMTGEPYHWANRSWFYPERTLTVGEFTQGLHDYAPQIDPTDDPTPLTASAAAELLRRAGGRIDTPGRGGRSRHAARGGPDDRRGPASVRPAIDFEGNLKK